MTTPNTATAPGWYPTGNGELGYWNGTSWTGQTMPAAQPVSAPLPPAPTFAPPTGSWHPGTSPVAPQGYLDGAPSTFGSAVSDAVKNTFVYRGRASRSSYWWFVLATFVAGFGVVLLLSAVAGAASGSALVSLLLVVALALYVGILLTSLSLTARRLHDIGQSGWWQLLYVVPFGGFAVFIMTLLPSQPVRNKHNI